MDTAFGLVPAAPAARARVLARLDLRRAGRAADRRIALSLQRMARQVMLGEIGVELFTRPVGERVELQPARRTIELEAREPLPRRRLETLASGDRGIEIGQRLFERLHLADLDRKSTRLNS